MSTDLIPVDRADLAPAPLDENPAAVYLASLAPGSRRTMQQALHTIAELLGFSHWQNVPWAVLRFQHTTALRSALMERYAAATANKMLSALRGTLKAAERLGQMPAEAYQRAVDLTTVQGERPDAAAGRALTPGELVALMEVCVVDETPAGARDAALFAVARLGLRRAEVVALRSGEYDRTTDTLMVHGKRNKTRSLPIEGGVREALQDWLAVRGEAAGPLFVRIRKGGELTRDGLTSQGVYHIMQERAKQAGVQHFTPHDLRRTFAGDLLDAGADIVTVQKLMGHSDANTTARYDRRGERAKRQAVKLLHLPYRRRSG